MLYQYTINIKFIYCKSLWRELEYIYLVLNLRNIIATVPIQYPLHLYCSKKYIPAFILTWTVFVEHFSYPFHATVSIVNQFETILLLMYNTGSFFTIFPTFLCHFADVTILHIYATMYIEQCEILYIATLVSFLLVKTPSVFQALRYIFLFAIKLNHSARYTDSF